MKSHTFPWGAFRHATAVSAAPPYASEATISNLKFVDSTITNGSTVEMTANWTFPANPATPAGFTIDFPSTMVGRGDTFDLTAQDTGLPIGTCVATATQLQCDILDSYVAANPVNLRGDVNFWVQVQDDITETQTKTYDFGGTAVGVTIQPSVACQEDCDFWWGYRKDGVIDYEKNVITWYIHIESDLGGMAGGEQIKLTETPDANQTLIFDAYGPYLMKTNYAGTDTDGYVKPLNWRQAEDSDYEVAPDGTMTFTTEAGYYYQAVYRTTIDGAKVEYYDNSVTVEIDGVIDGDFGGSARYAGGGGSGIGTDVGVFDITKSVTGNAVGLPADQEFTGTYTVTTPTSETLTGTWTVKAGETWRSDEFPRDSTVVLTEDAPTQPSNITWGTPTFSNNNFTLPGGTLTSVTLTNPADVKTGMFDVSKAITGTEGAIGRVPTGTTFTVDYSYPAGVGYAAGSGSLTINADGTPATSPALPVGAVVTLTEQTPAAVEGATWGTATISPSTITISDSATASFTVTNPITESMGSFSVQKTVSGDGSGLVPAGTIFKVDYNWTASDGRTGSGTLDVPSAGAAVTVGDIPMGSTVNLTEAAPNPVTGLTWLNPVFSQQSFTIGSGTTVAINLDNPTELNTGTFSAAKTITGTEGGLALVPAGSTFTINYSYPAGTGFAAGSGSITIGADGTPVSSPELPYGAEVTLTEQAPTATTGIAWADPVISPSTFTIGDGTKVDVTVENPVVETLGSFSLVKAVSGNAAGLVPAGTLFTVNYAWTTADGQSGEGSVDVTAGADPVKVEGIPGGATVTLTEATPGQVEGVQWLDPIFSTNGFTIVAGTTVAINLDNPTNLRSGVFSVRKLIDGTGAALVAPTTAFTVNYSYPAGEGFEAGSGTLTVKADGIVMLSDPLPFGAVVTLSEKNPGAVTNGEWTGAKFDTTTVTIGDGTTVNVVLTNTIKDVTPPPLAETGNLVNIGLAVSLIVLLIAAGLLLIARNRSRNELV